MGKEKIVVESGLKDECHPEVFTIIPQQPKEKKPGQLNQRQLEHFFGKGYVMIPDFFTDEDLEPVKICLEGLVENLAQKLFKAGKIKDMHAEAGLFKRLTLLEKDYPGTNIILHKIGAMPQEIGKLLANKRLLNVIEQLVGPDIGGSAVWNLRTKTPKSAATVVPWHQDCGYFDNDSYRTLIPTAWIPMLDTHETNGGMQMVQNAHRLGRVANHTCCAGPTWYIQMEEEEMQKTLGVDLDKDVAAVPVPYKGMLLFHNMTPHRSLPNISDDVRWSMDLRWHSLRQPDCFWGLKAPIVLRTADDPHLVPDWKTFNSVNRNEVQDACLDKEHDEFDATISGPWMLKWDVVNHNEHTDAMKHDDVWVTEAAEAAPAEEKGGSGEPVQKKTKVD